MKKLTIILCLTLASAVMFWGAPAKPVSASSGLIIQGETFRHEKAGVKFTLPRGWKAKPDGEVITVSSADDALHLVFWVPDEASFEAAVKDLDKELAKTIQNIKMNGNPTQDTHNGMAHYEANGTGDVEGTTITWSVDVLAAKTPLIILTFAAPTLFEQHADAYSKLVGSIKKND